MYAPATEISPSDFDVGIGQTAPAPFLTFTPSNAFEGTSDIWLTYSSSHPGILSVDANGLCTPHTVGIATYTVTSKITSVQGSAFATVAQMPNPDAQNKNAWCWVAAAKKVGTYNYRSEVLDTGAANLAFLDGLHSYGGVDFYGFRPGLVYTVDAGQRQIVWEAHGSDENRGGNSYAIRAGLRLASLNNGEIGTINHYTGNSIDEIVACMNDELDAGFWVVADVFDVSSGSGHSVVVKSCNADYSVYTYWDPWANEDGQFTDDDIDGEVIQLLTDSIGNRALRRVHFCRPID
jgi:hypothetical protein